MRFQLPLIALIGLVSIGWLNSPDGTNYFSTVDAKRAMGADVPWYEDVILDTVIKPLGNTDADISTLP